MRHPIPSAFCVTIPSSCAQFLLNANELVVLGHAVGTAHASGFYLSGVGSHGNVSNGSILRLARSVRCHRGVPMAVCHLNGLKRLRERPYLIDLDEDGISCSQPDTLF